MKPIRSASPPRSAPPPDRRPVGVDSPDLGWLPDAVTLLSGFLIVRLALPSQLVIPGLGGAGSPGVVVSLVLLAWWLWFRLHQVSRRPSSPVVVAALLFCGSILAAYVAATSRPINADEASLATLALIIAAGWMGVLLLAHDGVLDSGRLADLLNTAAFLGGLLGAFGLFQFVTEKVWVDQISIPGLTAHQTIYSTSIREGFTRPPGTAVHPIEFGAVLCMLLPITVVRGLKLLQAPGRRTHSVLQRWWPAAVLVFAVVLSLSRSALVGLVVGLVALVPALNRAQRAVGMVALLLLGMVVFIFVPGMIGSLMGLFGGISTDPGIASRLDSYGVALQYFQLSPWFGRGMATFLPRYRIFDNQYLLHAVEAGAVGVAALLLVIGAALWAGWRTRKVSTDPVLRGASAAVVAAVLVGAVNMALFDGFSFPMMPGVWFLAIGLAGGCYRLAREESWPASSA